VPSCWETLPGLENYRGRGWLHTTVPATAGKALRLVFGGVSHTATVYVDGKSIRQHYDAYSPWDALVPPGRKHTHEVVVEVDNTFGPHSCLHLGGDFYAYGGITRPVEAQAVPEVFIDKMFAVPVKKGKTWALEVRVRLRNWSETSLRRRVVFSVASQELDLGTVAVRAGAAHEVGAVLHGIAADPWTAETPRLYEATVRLLDGDTVVDDLIDRVGFREVRAEKKKLLLNGKPIRLRGYNRHEDHFNFGCALPVEAMAHDLALLKDLGCNFIRTSHYPNDMRFLDLCDELGFYVWEESHSKTLDLKHPLFRTQLKDHTVEMIEWHFNRPSIIIWGCLNECISHTKQGRTQHAWTLALMRKLDASRPVTYASFRGNDICFDLVDIIGFNLYPGWYWGEAKDAEEAADSFVKNVRRGKYPGAKNKPIIFSEFGAGALPGYHDPRRPKWSEEYQAAVLDEELRVFLNHPDIVGAAIWQFCDVRATEGAMNPRVMNNKGTVDECRRPKRAYEVVKQRMHEARARHARS